VDRGEIKQCRGRGVTYPQRLLRGMRKVKDAQDAPGCKCEIRNIYSSNGGAIISQVPAARSSASGNKAYPRTEERARTCWNDDVTRGVRSTSERASERARRLQRVAKIAKGRRGARLSGRQPLRPAFSRALVERDYRLIISFQKASAKLQPRRLIRPLPRYAPPGAVKVAG